MSCVHMLELMVTAICGGDSWHSERVVVVGGITTVSVVVNAEKTVVVGSLASHNQFHSTAVMNFITGNSIFCTYLSLTFHGLSIGRLRVVAVTVAVAVSHDLPYRGIAYYLMSKVWSECKYSVWKLLSRMDYQIMLISCVQKSAKYKGRIHECGPLKWSK